MKHKQYKFAIDMYETSASWAYKPAQYNLAVMYMNGEGIAVDKPRAMAWAALGFFNGISAVRFTMTIVITTTITNAIMNQPIARPQTCGLKPVSLFAHFCCFDSSQP